MGRDDKAMRVLFADDHELARDGFKTWIEAEFDGSEVLLAAHIDECLAIAKDCDDIDIVFLDLLMPGMADGAGLKRVREQMGDVPVAVLSASLDPQDVRRVMDQGAAGYIPKTVSRKVFRIAVELMLAGQRYVPEIALGWVEEGGKPVDEGPSPVDELPPSRNDEEPVLTEREGEILALLIDGHSNKEIGRRLNLHEFTIKSHLKRVFRKLDARNRAQAVKRAIDLGLSGTSS